MYSTIEMLQKIKEGQKAIDKSGDIVVKKDCGEIIVLNDTLSTKFIGKPLQLSGWTMNVAKWRLIPVKISFTEACKMLEKERPVTCLYNGKANVYNSVLDTIFIDRVIKGKWYEGEISLSDLI